MKFAFVSVLVLSLGLFIGCSKKDSDKAAPADKPAAAPQAKAEPPAAAPTPAPTPAAEIDWNEGQSSGQQTKDVPGEDYRNTLVDAELGAQITCSPDKTWKCKLESDGKFKIRDMSSNVFTLRVAFGATNAAEALDREIKYLEATLPEVKVAEKTEDSAVLDVGANPDWAKKVPRKAWLKVKEVNGKWLACHGIGGDYNYDNASKNYAGLCDSVAAAQ